METGIGNAAADGRRNAEVKGAPETAKVRLKKGRPGGWVNRLGRQVAPGEVVATDATTARWLLERGEFEAA